ncbi:MAG: RNA 2',3'-cyclic phosphodiesterase [Chloroflexota bacterium]|nr:RNA 2',3'-cyclic phosphodiesterase [Chloroflexota bacterium]
MPISPELRQALAVAVDALRCVPELRTLRWTAVESWHLTLAFLGPTPHDAVPEIAAQLGGVAGRHAPFRASAGGIGAFPAPSRARVLWLGVSEPDGRLAGLATDVVAALGLRPTSEFRAHLTLARAPAHGSFRLPRGGSWSEVAAALRGKPAATRLDVDTMVLMRSHLGRGTPHYEPLETFPLGAAPWRTGHG